MARAASLARPRPQRSRRRRQAISSGHAGSGSVRTSWRRFCVQNLRQDVRTEPDPACPLEIAWRLRRDRWGRGLASEAARAMAGFAFEALRANELYAVCNPANTASAQVMQRL